MSLRRRTVLGGAALGLGAARISARAQGTARYQPRWESIDRRPVPAWFGDAKFGIFIHWGLYSVPAWGPKGKYAEWYWRDLNRPNSETAAFHKRVYGDSFRYQDFAPQFKAELWEPAAWGELFRKAGAKYVVLTSKHHDGFALWPSREAWNWNAVDVGPHRDLAGDLAKAVKGAGLKMGYYYSLYEWYHPLFKKETIGRYVDEHMLPQVKDLVTRYEPSLLWTDGEWDYPSDVWKSTQFLSWLYNESRVKDEIVVNDRWGKETRSKHGGFFTTEYGKVHDKGMDPTVARVWEECRGIGASFGFSRREEIGEYATARGLVHLLVETVSRGGNLLLDIGPQADGLVPVVMQERLLEMGSWLAVNGEAIYGTRPFRTAAEKAASGHGTTEVRYTTKGSTLYAIALGWPGAKLTLAAPKAKGTPSATLLGREGALAVRSEEGKLTLELPALGPEEAPTPHAHVFKLTGVG